MNGGRKRTRRLNTLNVRKRVNAGSPQRREPDGDGVPILAKCSGERLRQDEGEQVEVFLTREGAGRVMRKSCSLLKEMDTDTRETVAVKAARRGRGGEVRKGLAEIPPEGISGGAKR